MAPPLSRSSSCPALSMISWPRTNRIPTCESRPSNSTNQSCELVEPKESPSQHTASFVLYSGLEHCRAARRFGSAFIQSERSDVVICLVILLNCAFMVFQIDLERERCGGPCADEEMWLRCINWLFLIIYMFELLLRLDCLRWGFFKSRWNIADLSIVLTVALGEVVSSNFLLSAAMLRCLRATQLPRIHRMIRSVRELRLLSCSLGAAVKTLLWALLVMIGMVTFWSVVVVFTLDPINQRLVREGFHTDQNCERCTRAFRTVTGSSLTILQLLISGNEWSLLAAPIIEEQAWTFLIFGGIVVTLGVGLVLVLAMVVGTTAEVRTQDASQQAISKISDRKGARTRLLKMFSEMDEDLSGTLSLQHLMKAYESRPELAAILDDMDVGREDFLYMCHTIEGGDIDEMTYTEFGNSLYTIRSQDSRNMLTSMSYHVLNANRKIERIEDQLKLFTRNANACSASSPRRASPKKLSDCSPGSGLHTTVRELCLPSDTCLDVVDSQMLPEGLPKSPLRGVILGNEVVRGFPSNIGCNQECRLVNAAAEAVAVTEADAAELWAGKSKHSQALSGVALQESFVSPLESREHVEAEALSCQGMPVYFDIGTRLGASLRDFDDSVLFGGSSVLPPGFDRLTEENTRFRMQMESQMMQLMAEFKKKADEQMVLLSKGTAALVSAVESLPQRSALDSKDADDETTGELMLSAKADTTVAIEKLGENQKLHTFDAMEPRGGSIGFENSAEFVDVERDQISSATATNEHADAEHPSHGNANVSDCDASASTLVDAQETVGETPAEGESFTTEVEEEGMTAAVCDFESVVLSRSGRSEHTGFARGFADGFAKAYSQEDDQQTPRGGSFDRGAAGRGGTVDTGAGVNLESSSLSSGVSVSLNCQESSHWEEPSHDRETAANELSVSAMSSNSFASLSGGGAAVAEGTDSGMQEDLERLRHDKYYLYTRQVDGETFQCTVCNQSFREPTLVCEHFRSNHSSVFEFPIVI